MELFSKVIDNVKLEDIGIIFKGNWQCILEGLCDYDFVAKFDTRKTIMGYTFLHIYNLQLSVSWKAKCWFQRRSIWP